MQKSVLSPRLCSQCARGFQFGGRSLAKPARSFTTSSRRCDAQVQQPPASETSQADASPPAFESGAGQSTQATSDATIGSRRRRAAIQSTSDIPFTQLPYQCFQEALKVLGEDRAEKVVQIQDQRGRIARLTEKLDAAQQEGANKTTLDQLKRSLQASKKHLEYLKVQADINDPLVKRRFEDGLGKNTSWRQPLARRKRMIDESTLGDMNKPVYRHLAEQKWRSYERKIVMQRIQQMNVVPDVLPKVDPTIQVRLSFGTKRLAHGVVVPSKTSEAPPTIHIQPFESGEQTVTVLVLDSDIPNTETDAFDYRLHALVTNIPITPTSGTVSLAELAGDSRSAFAWLPPTAQKGAPWHRLSVWVFAHPANKQLDVPSIQARYTRDTFNLRSFRDKYLLRPIGVTMFRSKWDEDTKAVMERHEVKGADVEFKKKSIEPMRYKKKDGARYR